jgi:DNA replication and repair protein RecF
MGAHRFEERFLRMLLDLWTRNLRNLEEDRFELGEGVNLFVGTNGSGKTSLLEACHVLARGRSFRTHRLARVVRNGESGFAVAGQLLDAHHGRSRAAVEWIGERRSRLDGQWLEGHWEIVRRMPLVAVHADSFEILTGVPEERRRLLDWGAFYVGSAFARDWQTWRRAHEQRNAALRHGDEGLAIRFEAVAAEAGTSLSGMRATFVEALDRHLNGEVTLALREGLQGKIEVAYRQGWPEHEGLAEAYARSRASDLDRGFGQVGPQKADLEFRISGRPAREASRGEQKRALNALVVAQGQVLMGVSNASVLPILLLDDAVAEMDAAGVGGIMAVVRELGWQCLVTTVDQSWAEQAAARQPGSRMFHVKHGEVVALV